MKLYARFTEFFTISRRFVAVGIGMAAFFIVGCTTTDAPAPTHYWENNQATTSKQYQSDDEACQGADDAATADVFSAADQSFADYRECMISRGYVLRTY